MAIATTATTKNVLMNPSPFFTENLLANHAPDPFPMARIKPNFQSILSLNAKTAKAASIYTNTTATLVALDRTRFIRLK